VEPLVALVEAEAEVEVVHHQLETLQDKMVLMVGMVVQPVLSVEMHQRLLQQLRVRVVQVAEAEAVEDY
jgi:hypothetical protein